MVKNDFAYNASIPAAGVFTVLFGICLLVHIGQVVKLKTMYMIVFVVAVLLEFIGYITRIVSIKDPNPKWPIIISTVGLIVAPAFMAAQSYMIVGRMFSYIGPEYAFIKHTRITKIFVSADVISILTQGFGGAIIADASGNLKRMQDAKDILLAGLSLQVFTFALFLAAAIAFDLKSRRSAELQPFCAEMGRMRRLWIAFYLTGALITIRSIYRLVEFASISFTAGKAQAQGYVFTHEWLFYAFDAFPSFITTVLLAVVHPGRYLPRVKGALITDEEPREAEEPKEAVKDKNASDTSF